MTTPKNELQAICASWRAKHPEREWTNEDIVEALLTRLSKSHPDRFRTGGVDSKGKTIWQILPERFAGQWDSIETEDVKAVLRRSVQRAIGQETIARKIAEGIDATETRLAQADGKFTDERQVPDYAQRRAYLAMAAEYAGYVEKDAPALSLQVGSLSICNASAPAATTTTDTTTTTTTPALPVLDVPSEPIV